MEVFVSLSAYKTDEFDVVSLSKELGRKVESLSTLNATDSSTLYAVVLEGDKGTYDVGTVLVYALSLLTVEYGFKYKEVKSNISNLTSAHKALGDLWYDSDMREITTLSSDDIYESLKRNSAIQDGGTIDGSTCVAVSNQDSAIYLVVVGLRADKKFELRLVSVYRIGRRFSAKCVRTLSEHKALNVAKRAMNDKAKSF